MRDQYAGDISDLLKLALLRKLARDDRTIGVAWYYNSGHDGRSDGRHREYCDEPKWASLDEVILNALKKLPEQSVAALEKLSIWPAKTRFHRVPMADTGNRRGWADNMRKTLQDASIVFLDPDNGVGPATERHATIAEVAAMRRPGRAVVLIKFPGRQQKHSQQIEDYHNLLHDQAGTLSVVTACTCVWLKQPRTRWFTIVDADSALIARAEDFAHLLNGIDKCGADVVCGRWGAGNPGSPVSIGNPSTSEQARPQAGTRGRTGATGNVCPECGHQFKGSGFDGIDAHWRARHEAIMPYREAWPLLKAGIYRR
jgi:hypothetical protein